jgi:starch phosphorylase
LSVQEIKETPLPDSLTETTQPEPTAESAGFEPKIAYFSMEIALDPHIPTYSGGLGVLAGDTLRSAADLGIPMVGVTLVYRKGYFKQRLDATGNQTEEAAVWKPEEVLDLLDVIAPVTIEGREVEVRAFRFTIRGVTGHEVPVYVLDTDFAPNSPWDRSLTDYLYGGDQHYRLGQEVILGMGGVGILHGLGFGDTLESYHMNEGHAALLALSLIGKQVGDRGLRAASILDVEALRRKCVFTTHTPVPAGHDQFPKQLVREALGDEQTEALEAASCFNNGNLNMTYVALRASHYINGVAMHHGEVSRGMFPRYSIRAITNGVHALTWTSPAFRELFDRYVPEWRRDNNYLRYALGIPLGEIKEAHIRAKRALLTAVKTSTGVDLDEGVMTIGFARRAAAYKRADLLFWNPERLKWMARHVGPMQIIYGGKAHPHDETSKAVIRRVFEQAAAVKDVIGFVYLENYDWTWGQLITSGSDLWLNTPQRPQEASGTSGMKAALNGVPSLSVLDGWWIEGHLEGVTGWAIGHGGDLSEDASAEVASLYDKLESVILPMFYGRPVKYTELMRSAIAINGSFFNTQRMLSQYVSNAYSPEEEMPSLNGESNGTAQNRV